MFELLFDLMDRTCAKCTIALCQAKFCRFDESKPMILPSQLPISSPGLRGMDMVRDAGQSLGIIPFCLAIPHLKLRYSNLESVRHTGANHTVPYGTVLRGRAVPGTSCRATIARSLRDMNADVAKHIEGLGFHAFLGPSGRGMCTRGNVFPRLHATECLGRMQVGEAYRCLLQSRG